MFLAVVVADGVTTADDSITICELGTPPGLPPESGTAEEETGRGALLLLLPPMLVLVEAGVAADDDEDEPEPEPAPLTAPHVRLYRGVVVKVLPMTPKLGSGVAGAASWSVYHQMLSDWNSGQPTSCQYVSAFSREGTAWPTVLPLTGKPVSVIQMGLLAPTACRVAARAASKSDLLFSMPLAFSCWK